MSVVYKGITKNVIPKAQRLFFVPPGGGCLQTSQGLRFFFDIPGMICMGPIWNIYIVDILNRYKTSMVLVSMVDMLVDV